jgi:general secretion pathway protein G
VLLVGGLVLGPVLFVGALVSSTYECRAWRRSVMLRAIEDALKLHRVKTGRYPTTEEGLEALVASGALRELPTDSWGRPYFYALIRGRPMVWTFGQDGVPGGEGADADLYNVSWREPSPP